LPTRHRKVRRMRGSRTHGWGVSGQHRDSGMRGGRGRAGTFKHKKTRLLAEGVKRGKQGFARAFRRTVRTINIGDLTRITPETPKDTSKGELPLLDLSRLGYTKLLGEGVLTRPMAVRVEKASKSAVRKVEAAGGKIVHPK